MLLILSVLAYGCYVAYTDFGPKVYAELVRMSSSTPYNSQGNTPPFSLSTFLKYYSVTIISPLFEFTLLMQFLGKTILLIEIYQTIVPQRNKIEKQPAE
jgi:hypothetical protein